MSFPVRAQPAILLGAWNWRSAVNLPAQPNFKAGHYEIQEEASQLAVLLTNAKPNETVIEVGAGGGGKTLALAALMENRGRIMAVDSVQERLTTMSKRGERAGISGVETLTLPADPTGLWQPIGGAMRRMERCRASADCVLIDAPCSGSGVLRRSPDAKWHTVDHEAVATVQKSLLRQSAGFVKNRRHTAVCDLRVGALAERGDRCGLSALRCRARFRG